MSLYNGGSTTTTLAERREASERYWRTRAEDDFQKRCVRCKRSRLDTDLFTPQEALRFRTEQLCIYCQHAVPSDMLPLPSWVNHVSNWGIKSAAAKKSKGGSGGGGIHASCDGGDYDDDGEAGDDSDADVDFGDQDVANHDEDEVIDAEEEAEKERIADAEAID